MTDIAILQQSSDQLSVLPPYLSPTLKAIPAARRPNPSTICEGCPMSLWFAAADGLTCFCRFMNAHVYSNENPNVLTQCDGEVMANAERLASMESGE